jgi:hypothetical protein
VHARDEEAASGFEQRDRCDDGDEKRVDALRLHKCQQTQFTDRPARASTYLEMQAA